LPNRNVDLTQHFDEFIEAGVNSGRFSNASEVVREGLRLLEQREKEDQVRIEWLRTAAREGFDELDRGEGTELEANEQLDSYMGRLGADVAAEIAAERKSV
jgi:antitoxin ParD1/3/4